MTGTYQKDYPTGTPAQTDYIPYVSNPGGIWEVKNTLVNNLVPSGSVFVATNNSAYQLTPGMIAIFDSAHDSSVKTSVLSGDPSVVGVALDTISIGATGRFAISGIQTVAVTGNVTRGHWLVQSTTAGYAKDSGSIQKPNYGAVGMAMTAYGGGSTSTVSAFVNINPYTSSTVLQQLATQTMAAGTLTFGHTVDSGTDLLIVMLGAHNNGTTITITSITWTANGQSGQTMVQDGVYNVGGTALVAGYKLRNPNQGAGTITMVITGWTTDTPTNKAFALNWIGSQPTPIRTSSYAADLSKALAANTGDIILDLFVNQYSIGLNNGQTNLANGSLGYNGQYYILDDLPVASGGSITSGCAGTSASPLHAMMVISGS